MLRSKGVIKALRKTGICNCGCGERCNRKRYFAPGHNLSRSFAKLQEARDPRSICRFKSNEHCLPVGWEPVTRRRKNRKAAV
jgi:hypothetical protein